MFKSPKSIIKIMGFLKIPFKAELNFKGKANVFIKEICVSKSSGKAREGINWQSLLENIFVKRTF